MFDLIVIGQQSYLAVMEEINLLEDPGPAVRGHLLNDLDRVLDICEDVHTGLHGCVCPLTKNLPCQAVDLLKGIGGKGGRAGSSFLLSPCCLCSLLLGSYCGVTVKI